MEQGLGQNQLCKTELGPGAIIDKEMGNITKGLLWRVKETGNGGQITKPSYIIQ